jgi:hypothetical protein
MEAIFNGTITNDKFCVSIVRPMTGSGRRSPFFAMMATVERVCVGLGLDRLREQARGVGLHLLAPRYEPLRLWLLRCFCHRTGYLRRVKVPLYRLRSALSRLWQRYPPCFAALGKPRHARCLVSLT